MKIIINKEKLGVAQLLYEIELNDIRNLNLKILSPLPIACCLFPNQLEIISNITNSQNYSKILVQYRSIGKNMSLNMVNLVGRTGADPEIRYFDSGSVKCRLTLAVNRRGKRDEGPDWFELEIWGKTAEIAANYTKKGSLIGIQGSLKIDTWSDRNTGVNRSKPVVRVDRLDLLGSKRDNESYNSDNDEF